MEKLVAAQQLFDLWSMVRDVFLEKFQCLQNIEHACNGMFVHLSFQLIILKTSEHFMHFHSDFIPRDLKLLCCLIGSCVFHHYVWGSEPERESLGNDEHDHNDLFPEPGIGCLVNPQDFFI